MSVLITDLERCAGEALMALEWYNEYDIGTDRYAHSTDLIHELRKVLNHRRECMREPPGKWPFKKETPCI